MWKLAWRFLLHKERTQKYKFEIWLLKSIILDPQKSAVWVFEENPQKNVFFVFRLWFSFKNNRCTNVFLASIFENAQKKVMDHQKRHFGCFWQLITVFWCVLKNTDQNNICVSIVFKAETKKIWRHFLHFLFQNSFS